MAKRSRSLLMELSRELKRMESKLLSMLVDKKIFCTLMVPESGNTLMEESKKLTLMEPLKPALNKIDFHFIADIFYFIFLG